MPDYETPKLDEGWTNTVRRVDEGILRKTYTGGLEGTGKMTYMTLTRPMKYQTPGERKRTETDKLEGFADAGLPVPELIEEGENHIDIEELDITPVSAIIREDQYDTEDKYDSLEESASLLRDVHDAGYTHGDASTTNFGVDSGDVFTYDLEHKVKPRRADEAVEIDYNNLILSGLTRASDDVEPEGVVDAVRRGYGRDVELRRMPLQRHLLMLRKPDKWSNWASWRNMRNGYEAGWADADGEVNLSTV